LLAFLILVSRFISDFFALKLPLFRRCLPKCLPKTSQTPVVTGFAGIGFSNATANDVSPIHVIASAVACFAEKSK
jgi:hypothetical protein